MTRLRITDPEDSRGTLTGEVVASPLKCLEVWGGNRRVDHAIELPGLSGWIHSDPVEPANLGGDVHYVSVCSKGIISRFALADVSGHGRSSSVAAQLLRDLIRKYINYWDQSELMRELNDSLEIKLRKDQFVTATLFAYCRPTRELVFTNAGHPAALWYHGKSGTWDWLEPATPFARPVEGLPLGIIPGTDYVQVAVRFDRHDVVILYTDGITDATNSSGNALGGEGLFEIAKNLPVESTALTANNLIEAVRSFRGKAPRADDQSFLIFRQLEG